GSLACPANAHGQEDVAAAINPVQPDPTESRRLMRLRDPKREVLFTAAMDVVEAFDDEMLALHTAAHFRESELSPLVQLLHAAGRHEAAMSWERFNETGDDGTPEPDDEAQDHTEPVTV
ncbi:hypothetical protein ACWDA8_10160, partial [Streptomyces sp. NPDC001130]